MLLQTATENDITTNELIAAGMLGIFFLAFMWMLFNWLK